jgi:hypothetical protein
MSKLHKKLDLLLILKVCDVIFCMLAKHIIWHFLGFLEASKTFLSPERSENPLKWPIMCCACIKNNLLNSWNLCYNLTINVPVVFMARDVLILHRAIYIYSGPIVRVGP